MRLLATENLRRGAKLTHYHSGRCPEQYRLGRN